MDFFVKGRVLISDETQLAALLESQKNMKEVSIKSGRVLRGIFADGPSEFVFEVRAFEQGGAMVYFNELKALMVAQNIPGSVGWHECFHEEGDGNCSWDGRFKHPGGDY